MGARIQRTVEPIQLDVDWLIGKRTDPRLRLPARKRRWSGFTVVSLGLIALSSLLIAWPKLSTRWLAHEFRRALEASGGVDESLELLVSLNELGDLSHREIVSMLGSEEPHLRNTSYQWLRERFRKGVGSEEWLRSCHLLLSELVNAQFTSNESVHLRNQLCAEAMEEMDRLSPNSDLDRVKELCRVVLASQPIASAPTMPSAGRGQQRMGALLGNPSSSLSSSRGSEDSVRSTENADGFSNHSSLMDIPLPPIPEPDAGGVLAASAESKEKQDESGKAQGNPLRTTAVAYTSIPESTRAEIQTVSSRADQMDLSGLESLALENLFTLLSSTQERRVRMVCDELFRRGVPTEIVEIAIDMARGDSSVQLEAMEQAVRGRAINPVPLLAWMAQSQDRKIRHRAIALLGAMQDRDAHLKLRSLFQREPDQQLQQMIQQALVAGAGANRGNLP